MFISFPLPPTPPMLLTPSQIFDFYFIIITQTYIHVSVYIQKLPSEHI